MYFRLYYENERCEKMHDSLLKDIQIAVNAYLDEQLAQKDTKIAELTRQNKQLMQEIQQLKRANAALKQPEKTRSFAVHNEVDAKNAMEFISTRQHSSAERFMYYITLYRWNMKHLHYSIDAMLALWLTVMTDMDKKPLLTDELRHLHTQFMQCSAASYVLILDLLLLYKVSARTYFNMLGEVIAKHVEKADRSFTVFASLTLAIHHKEARYSKLQQVSLYESVLQHTNTANIIKTLKQYPHIAQLFPQLKITTAAKAAPTTATKNWDTFISQATIGKIDAQVIVPMFIELIEDNLTTQAYTMDFLRSIWKRIFLQYLLAEQPLQKEVQQRKLHDYFIDEDGRGVFSLIRLYHEQRATSYSRSLLDAVVKKLMIYPAYKQYDVPILLTIYYNQLQQRYFQTNKVAHYYRQQATERAKKMVTLFQRYEVSPSVTTFEQAYSEVQMVDVYLEKIGLHRKTFGSRVFKPFYNAPDEITSETEIDFSIPEIIDTIENPEQIQVFNQQNSLVPYGYQLTGKTADERWQSLLQAVAIIGLARVVHSLQYYIKLRIGDEEYVDAIALWSEDLRRLQQAHYEKRI